MFSLWVKFGTLSKNFFDFLTTKNTFSRKVSIIQVVWNGLNYKSGNLFFEKEILRNILNPVYTPSCTVKLEAYEKVFDTIVLGDM